MGRVVPLLLLSVLLLPACESPRPVVPGSLLDCLPRPPIPDDNADDATLAEFIVALDERGEDCAGRLARVREVLLP